MQNTELSSKLNRYLSFYKTLSEEGKNQVLRAAMVKRLDAGASIQSENRECSGLTIVDSGQLRAYYITEDGREITLYRLLHGDSCIMTMSCVLHNITFDINIEAEKPSEIIVLPTTVFSGLSESNPAVKKFESEHLAQRFSDVFWVLEQAVFKGTAKRVALYLLEQASLNGSDDINITHEAAARDLGTAREVVSRMLKYFENDGLVILSRGKVRINNIERIKKMAL